MKQTIILERGDGELWGRLSYDPGEDKAGFLHTTVGATVEEVTNNIRGLIADSLEHDLKDDPYWADVDPDKIEFKYGYDMTAFFEIANKALKINSIAEKAGINKGLARQYAAGIKFPSEQQAKRLEEAVHELGKELIQLQLV
ncbi:hypothetical protein [Larkinella arboricola]